MDVSAVAAVVAELQASAIEIGSVGLAVLLLVVASRIWRWVAYSIND